MAGFFSVAVAEDIKKTELYVRTKISLDSVPAIDSIVVHY